MNLKQSATELLDVLDPQGMPLGIARSRDEVHQKGLWHRTVHIWIINSQKQLLLQKRSQNKESYPGLWDISAAGHITAGDSSRNAAIRELKEELGIGAAEDELEFLFTVSHHFEDPTRQFIDNEISDVYLTQRELNVETVTIGREEVDSVKFIGIRGLKKQLKENPGEFVGHDEEYRRLFDVIMV
jgi:isopentenyl-diphosphate Delta-isomerase